jgi:AcrR family transcriptional regulator
MTSDPGDAPHVTARRRAGERSRDAILGESARLATIEGIDGLSIGRLAQAVGMSKSGLYAHFGSKEELQLATIEAANEIFERRVLAPAAASTGFERLRLLAQGYLEYIEADIFPGGCFFASVLSEMDTQPGAVRDRLVRFLADWLGQLDAAIRSAQAEGSLDPAEDPADLTFEIEAALFLANAQFVVLHTSEPIERARRAITRRLAAVATSGEASTRR